MKKKLDCIILAAGLSKRMGCWKQQLPYQNGTLLDASIANALIYCARVIIVAGYQASQLINQYQKNPKIKFVVNPHYQQGMFSSIQCGVKEISCDAFFIALGDMPCIDPQVFALLQKKRDVVGNKILFPGNVLMTGHPVLFPKSIIPKVLQADSQTTMKQLLEPKETQYLNLPSCMGIFKDIDTLEDYDELICLKAK